MSGPQPYPVPAEPGDPNDPNNPYRFGLPPAPPPPAAELEPEQVAPGHRPPQVVNAVRLMYARAGFGIISLIVLFVTRDDLKRKIRTSNRALSSSQADTAIEITAVLGIVVLVLYVLLAIQVARGRNWARIVTWVIGGLAILGFLGNLSQPESVFYRALAAVTAVIDIFVVVLLALPPSSAYFARRRRN